MYESIHPSIQPHLILSFIHPPTQLLGYHLLFSDVFSLMPPFLSSKAHPRYKLPAPVGSELFPRHIEGERQPWQKTLSSSLASQLWTPHTRDNQNDCHVRNYPEKYPFDIQTENTPARHVMQL